MTKRKLTKAEIRLDKNGLWIFRIKGAAGAWEITQKASTKAEVMRLALADMSDGIAEFGASYSLRIFGKNGKVLEERTYPRAMDSPQTKG